MSRRAAVTGAYGYLGSLVRDRLASAGWETLALVRSPRTGDIAQAWSLSAPEADAALAGVDALVHCAYDFAPIKERDVWQANVEGTQALLASAKRAGVSRVIVLSSMSAYEGTDQVYGKAKLAIERATLEAGGVAVRPGLVYGDAPSGMAGALTKLTQLPLVPFFRQGARQFPVHEDDFADVLVRILEDDQWTPEVFGVAQPESVSFRTLLESLGERAGRRRRFVPVPWQLAYWTLRLAELPGSSLPLRSDSLLGLVRPAPDVPPSQAFPDIPTTLRRL